MVNTYNTTFSSSSPLSLINSFQAHTFGQWVIRIKQSPFNSNLVATSGQDWTVKIWNVVSISAEWTLLRTYDSHFPYEVYGLEWLDADTIASSGYGYQAIKIWSVSTGETKREIYPGANILNLKLLTNKSNLAVGLDTDIQIYDIRNFNDGTTLLSTLRGHRHWVMDLVQLDDNTLASCSHDHTARIWDLKTNECKFILEGHRDRVYVLKQINSTILASGSWDFTIKLWDTSSGKLIRTLEGHTDSIHMNLELINNGQLLISGGSNTDKTIKTWNWQTGECLSTTNTNEDMRSFALLVI